MTLNSGCDESGVSSRTSYVTKPETGKYQVKVNNDKAYSIDICLYDRIGELKKISEEDKNAESIIEITYDKESSNNSNIVTSF